MDSGYKQKTEEFMKHASTKDKEQVAGIQSQMKTGRMIALIGTFCPLFWIALFTGQSTGAVLFNFCHSMLFVVIGLLMYFRGKRKVLILMSEKEKKSSHKSKTADSH